MKIVLVDPGFGERSWGTFGESHWTSIIHQGLCGLSACCKRAGFDDVHLLDTRQMSGWDELERRFAELSPDVVGLTMRSCDIKVVAEIARRFKTVKPDVRTVVGGVHVSIDPEFVQGNPDYDHVVAGEGEITFVRILQAISKGQDFPRFSWGERPDLDDIPFIERELYPYTTTMMLPNYPGVFPPPMVTMVCSRGCLFRCTFCAPHSRTHFGKGVRCRSVKNVIAELEGLREKYDFNCVKFYDYTFTQRKEWVEEFCDLYASIAKPFWIQSRADLICGQAALIAKLKKVGLKMVGVGFESGSDKVLTFLRKGATREINAEAARIVKDNGVLLSASFMLGTPEEEEEDVEATVSLAREIKPHFTSVAFFTPIPGNELYDYCKERNLIIKDDPEMWVEFSPGVPKLKGKDYDRLRKAAEKIMGDRFGGAIMGKVIRYLYVKTKYHYRLRNFLVRLYSGWVSSRAYARLFEKRAEEPPRDE